MSTIAGRSYLTRGGTEWTPQFAVAIDPKKCIGCGLCVVACKKENKVPWAPKFNRTWVERYLKGLC